MKRKELSLTRQPSLSQRIPKDFDDNITEFHKSAIGLRKEKQLFIIINWQCTSNSFVL
jgi:hypothetical protein